MTDLIKVNKKLVDDIIDGESTQNELLLATELKLCWFKLEGMAGAFKNLRDILAVAVEKHDMTYRDARGYLEKKE